MTRTNARQKAVAAACLNWAAQRVIRPSPFLEAQRAALEAVERVSVALAAGFTVRHPLGGGGASE